MPISQSLARKGNSPRDRRTSVGEGRLRTRRMWRDHHSHSRRFTLGIGLIEGDDLLLHGLLLFLEAPQPKVLLRAGPRRIMVGMMCQWKCS